MSPNTVLHSDKTSFQTTERLRHPLDNWSRPKSRPILIALKAYPRVAAYCFALSLSALLTGYDVIVVGSITALPHFQ
jgi:hypothetical protein